MYAWGEYVTEEPGFVRRVAEFKGDKLIWAWGDAKFEFFIRGDGTMRGRRRQGGGVLIATLKRSEIVPAPSASQQPKRKPNS